MSETLPLSEGVRATGDRPRTGGYIDQWQRELERAYRQRVDTMQSTGLRQGDSSVGHQVAGPAGDLPAAGATGPGMSPTVRPDGLATANPVPFGSAGSVPLSEAAPTTMPGPMRQDHVPTLTTEAPRTRTLPGGSRAAAVDRSGRLGQALAKLLPDGSSVKLLQSGGSLHLVVRDAALEPGFLLRIVSRLRAALGPSGRLLSTITLNGARLWQSEPDHRPVAADADSSAVDRTY